MIIALLLFGILLMFAVTSISGAPWVPARAYDLDQLLDDSKLKHGQLFIELGCGDGRLLKVAARRGARVVGYELNPVLWLIAWLRNFGNANIKVKFRNLWLVDISQADVVMTFLVPRTMPRLGQKAKHEMKKGARLVSYIFPVKDQKATKRGKSWYIYQY